jgi:hypothetical protein
MHVMNITDFQSVTQIGGGTAWLEEGERCKGTLFTLR